METVIAGSTCYLQVVFKDKDGNLAIPSAITYRVLCLTTGTEIRSSTAVSAASSIEIVLTGGTDNVIQTSTNQKEVRRVLVTSTYSGSQSLVEYYDYTLINPVNV